MNNEIPGWSCVSEARCCVDSYCRYVGSDMPEQTKVWLVNNQVSGHSYGHSNMWAFICMELDMGPLVAWGRRKGVRTLWHVSKLPRWDLPLANTPTMRNWFQTPIKEPQNILFTWEVCFPRELDSSHTIFKTSSRSKELCWLAKFILVHIRDLI